MYNKICEVTELGEKFKEKAAIVFDCMQNIPIPRTHVQEMFYYRNLWHYVFYHAYIDIFFRNYCEEQIVDTIYTVKL